MRHDQAEKLAVEIRGSRPEFPVAVERIPDAAPEPYGYVVTVGGQRVNTPAQWSQMEADDGATPVYQYRIRIPHALAASLQDLADAHRRSFNTELQVALEKYVERNR